LERTRVELSHLDLRDPSAILDRCMAIDRIRLGRRTAELGRIREPNRDQRLQIDHLISLLHRSIERRDQRLAATPSPVYSDDLPVVLARREIMEAIRQHQVVVICGATGSGKTTQLPKICLELGRGASGLIGHTQPRRIAARSVATRIAHELGSVLGSTVGYKVRFTDHVSRSTIIKLMTDGILLAETQRDLLLAQYDTIIIDEAHERSLNIDFLLGYIRQLLPRRPDLKLIITSATIDPQSFAAHFADASGKPAPVIEVSGRSFPVEVRYRSLSRGDDDTREIEMEHAIVDAALELIAADTDAHTGSIGGGRRRDRDILVFLPGEREIRETADELRKVPRLRDVEIISLFARLSTEEQNRVFQPHDQRRIVLATNVAETSLTVPGVKYVIDSALARISRYSPRTKVQRLPIEPISRASAQQRSGRCGRTSPGIAIRLCGEDEFNTRQLFTDPEILRTNLASVILQMKALGLAGEGGDISTFPFLQAPSPGAVRDGYDTLVELGAIDARGDLTTSGRKLAKLPVDPRIGRMVLAGDEERCLSDVLIIASALSVQDPRERPIDKQTEADTLHEKWKHEESDFLAFVNLWRGLAKQESNLSGSQLRKWCKANFLSYVRIREWQDIHRQLSELSEEIGLNIASRPGQGPAGYEQVHRALLTGLLSNIGTKSPEKGSTEYDGARGLKFSVFPGSVLFKLRPKWIVAAELVRTSRLYGRTVASISPQWIEKVAAHLVTRDFAEPHWSADTAQVAAYETVSLFGLPLIKRRRAHYGPIDPAVSRTIFIEHALVKGEYMTSGKFLEHNFATQRNIQRLEEKKRKTDLLGEPSSRFNFYAEKVPEGVFDGPGFERWRKKAEARAPDLLVIPRERMLAPSVQEPTADQYPDAIQVITPTGPLRIPIEYKHKHNDPDDGLTAIIPLEHLTALDPARFDWLVPGFAREKVVELIRALPKPMRVNLAPAAGFGERAIAALAARYGDGDFLSAVAEALTQLAPQGVTVRREALAAAATATDQAGLPIHLRMNFRVIEQLPGKPIRTVASGRDLHAIKKELRRQTEDALVGLPAGPYNRGGLVCWEFAEQGLPEQVNVLHRGGVVHTWIGLTDETPFGRAEPIVGVRPCPDRARSIAMHRTGVTRLLALDVAKESRSLIATMPGIDRLFIMGAPLIRPDAARRDLAELIALEAFAGLPPEQLSAVRNSAGFDAALDAGWDRLGATGRSLVELVQSIFTEHHQLIQMLDSAPAHWTAPLADIRHQLGSLFLGRFLVDTPFRWLIHFPRYLLAARRRIERLAAKYDTDTDGITRDAQRVNEMLPLWSNCIVRIQHAGGWGNLRGRWEVSDLAEFRWLIEELRVSLFAQDLRTAVPISIRKLTDQWAKIVAEA